MGAAPRQSAQAARPAQAAQTPQRPAPRTKPDIPPQASADSPFRRVTPLPSAKEEKPFAQAAAPVPAQEAPPVPEAATQPVPAAPASETSSQQALKAPAPTPEVASQEQPWLIRGELFRTYIMVEQGDKVVLIDKHAAHERANFDRLKAADYQPMVQELLSPVTFIPAPEDRTALLEQLPLLARFGFEVEEFGGSALAVRACPDYLDAGDIEDALLELAQRLQVNGAADPAAARDELLHTMACKAAIKGGQKNGSAELEEVVQMVMSGAVKYCPHGRPVAIELTK